MFRNWRHASEQYSDYCLYGCLQISIENESMNWVLIVAIWLYRRLPDRFKRSCLFKENCSSFVERTALESGLLSALSALRSRVSQCRPRYSVYFDHQIQDWQVCLADGSIKDKSVMA